ncbi:MAG: polyprenol phosphomannose-dependent alpha 1,6 mannosyltransferase MptB [Herbiconiux sp.]|nr:polyprenol phosphomannose-dependent alpha 1,6 mannosyltransferase MptB [Herbiconiux sp.]
MRLLPPRLRLIVGIVGSAAIALGSLGVGWLGPSSVLREWALFELLRNSRGAVSVSAMLVVIGALLLLAAWLSLGLSLLRESRRPARAPATTGLTRAASAGTGPLGQVVASAAAWTAPLLFALPMFSRDMFAYVGQGRLMAAGLDPYTTGVSDLPGWYGIGVDPLWADTQTPYGPVFVWLERLVVMATGPLPTEVAVYAFRGIAVLGLALLAYYAWRIARLRGLNEAAVLWVVAASPLVLMNFVVAGHNDSLMLGLILGGVYYALKERPILGTVLVALAIGVKPIALIALPVIGLIWAGSQAGWGAVIRRWLSVAAIGIGGVALMGWGAGVGVGWISALATPVTISSWYAPASILGVSLGGLANGVGADGETAQLAVKLILLAAGCAGAVYLMIRRRRADPLWLLFGCFALIVLSSPVVHPWYGLWLLTLLAVANAERLWALRTIVYATAFFLLIGLCEPLDLIPRLEGDAAIPVVVISTALVGVVGLVVVAELAVRRRSALRGLRVGSFAA